MARMSRKTVLAVLAHPDDAEILCGGTLCLLADAGWQVHVATMTPGDCGSMSLPPKEISLIRREEGRAAAKFYAGEFHCLEERDLQIVYSEEALRKVCVILRMVQPDIVITHSPSDYMVDHEETSRIVRASCFNSTIPSAPAQVGALPLEAIPALYYTDPIEGNDAFGQPVSPDFVIDVSYVLDRKQEALEQHESQKQWLLEQHGVDDLVETMTKWSKQRGISVGVGAGEGFRQHVAHAYPKDNILADALSAFYHRVHQRKK